MFLHAWPIDLDGRLEGRRDEDKTGVSESEFQIPESEWPEIIDALRTAEPNPRPTPFAIGGSITVHRRFGFPFRAMTNFGGECRSGGEYYRFDDARALRRAVSRSLVAVRNE